MAKFQLIKAKPISYGSERPHSAVRYIVIHYTGNSHDTAKGNCEYFHRYGDGNTRNAGAHFFVDRGGNVVQSIPMKLTAWAVGGFVTKAGGAASYYLKCTNSNSVSIELCDNATKDPSEEQIKAVKELIKYIRSKCPNAKTVIRHWDVSGKDCPARMTGTNNKKWANFKKAVGADSAETVKTAKKIEYPTATLKIGMTGSQVKKLQDCLNQLMKAGLEVDGSFGFNTQKAVFAFQKKHGLMVDGVVGPKTRAKIKAEMEKKK